MSRTLPFVSGSVTSLAAAESMKPASSTYRRLVLQVLRQHPLGLTDEEIVGLTGLNPSTARPRRIELLTMGAIRDSGTTRKTKSGRQATVWLSVPVTE